MKDKLPDGIHAMGLDCPQKAVDSLRDGRWPVLVKLHGDYLFRKLKNTSTELAAQDSTLRSLLTEHCARRGLAVVGYSGRDNSIMDALGDALRAHQPFPHGLFWFVRLGEVPKDNVLCLLESARAKGCHAGYLQVGSFDELMADIFMAHHSELLVIRDMVKGLRGRKQAAPLTYEGRGKWPVLRTNALEILSYPATCTVFKATIGGAKEVKHLALPHRERITAGRRKNGVVAFGTKQELMKIFETCDPCEFDSYSIEPKRFRYSDSVEAGLFYDAIAQGISDATSLSRSVNRKGRILYVEDDDVLSKEETRSFKAMFQVAPLRKISEKIIVHEGVQLSVEYRDLRLWLILEPTILVTTDGVTPYVEADRSEIGREDLANRFNRKANQLLDFWIQFLSRRCGSPIAVSFPKGAAEANFSVSTLTAFARQKP